MSITANLKLVLYVSLNIGPNFQNSSTAFLKIVQNSTHRSQGYCEIAVKKTPQKLEFGANIATASKTLVKQTTYIASSILIVTSD